MASLRFKMIMLYSETLRKNAKDFIARYFQGNEWEDYVERAEAQRRKITQFAFKLAQEVEKAIKAGQGSEEKYFPKEIINIFPVIYPTYAGYWQRKRGYTLWNMEALRKDVGGGFRIVLITSCDPAKNCLKAFKSGTVILEEESTGSIMLTVESLTEKIEKRAADWIKVKK